MSRSKGLSAFSANFEPQMASPLDARMLVDTVADLTIEAVWQAADGAVYAYKGMIVSVCNDTEENNGVYRLMALPVTIADNWVKLGSGSGLTWYPDDDPPAEPKKGDAYYDTVQGKSVVWDGAAWQTVAADGIQGLPGTAGADGTTPHIDEATGNWFIGETDTDIPATGPAGEDGVDGTDGTNGITPHIDAGGNWFIGETDTGIPAQGSPGEAGSDGTDGISITWLGTLAAPPDSPQQNQAYYNSTDKKAYIYNIEDAVGTWEIIAQDGVDTFPVVYSNEDPSVVGAGGILPGTAFTNITFPQFMNMLLYPELFPTGLVAPSFTFTPDQAMGFREVGEVISSIVFTTAFDRGAINPQYQSESLYRSGPPNQYIYTGTGLTTATKTELSDVQTVMDYTVIAGLQGWTAAVAHDAGVQPKGSDGTNFDSPYAAGTLSAIERNIIGVYPFFATTVNTFSFTKQPLAAMDSAYVETAMAVETDAYKQAVDFPVGWSAIVGIQAYNTAFEKWEWICGSAAESLATFTQSSVSRTVNGNSVNYTRYTHNGVRIGSRQLRWYTTLG